MTVRLITIILALLVAVAPTRAEYQNGIDVSVYQKSIKWPVVKEAGIKFAFTKATEGNHHVDSRFAENMAGAQAVGILIGSYHFARPDSDRDDPQDAANEANHFVDTIQPYFDGKSLVMRPVLDVEKLPGLDKPAKDKEFLSQWIHSFAAAVNKRLGFNPIIYTNSNYAKNYLDKSVNQYDLWLANWTKDTSKPPAASQYGIWSKWPFWQYTSSGTVEGISARVDRDVFDGTMLQLAEFVPSFHPGDFNSDGIVNDRDAAVWRAAKGQTVNPGTGADCDFNGAIDQADYAIWKANRGKSYVSKPGRTRVRRSS